jgi:tRNA(fMet)-specific endonuclease VapC
MASYVIKSRSAILESRLRAIPKEAIAVSVITRAELTYGLQRLPPEHGMHLGVQRFLRTVRTIPWQEEAADKYAAIRHRLTISGSLIGELDMMIAAHAMALGATLVTNNTRHFERTAPPLLIENWLL